MTRLLFMVMVVTVCTFGCASTDDPNLLSYPNNDLELAVGNAAKMACSCIFVMEMPEDFCVNWVRPVPDIGSYQIDYTTKRVSSSAFVSWAGSARWVSERQGCVLE